MDRRSTAGALLALAACLACVTAAPRYSDSTALDLHESGESSDGCYYNFQHYGEGDRIMTNEPCLNCTCHNRMLMCYLRVCPFTKPIGQDCTIEKRADQCCPIITCPDVPVDLLTSTSTTSPAEYGMTGVGHLDKYGCSINEKFYPEGAKVPPMPNKPCEHCYCIRNMTTCVMQECTLHVDGCTPIYHKDVCCPVRYSCDHTDDLPLMLDHTTTTEGTTPGFQWTTTVAPAVKVDCVHGEEIFSDGALIKTDKACDHCYCMKGDIVCVVQECGTPMENEGKNCTSLPPREGQCCPDTYICEGDSEVTTEPPRRYPDKDGNDYRVDDKNEFSTEGSGFSDVTDEPILNTEDNILKITETPDEATSTILNKVTDEPESVTIADLFTIKEDSKDITSTTINPVHDELQHVTEDNLSTVKDIHYQEHTYSTLSITDIPQHITEDNLSTIKEVSKEETPDTNLITDKPEYVTEGDLFTTEEVSKEKTPDTNLITDKPEHVTEDNLSTIKEVSKEETPDTILITDKPEYVTEGNLFTTEEVSKEKSPDTNLITNKPEYVTEDNLSTVKEILDEQTPDTNLITDKPEHVIEDNLSTINQVLKEKTPDINLNTDKPEHVTEDLSTIKEILKEETPSTNLITEKPEHVTEDNLSTKEVSKEGTSPSTLSSATEKSEYSTEVDSSSIKEMPEEVTSHTILGSVTEEVEHVTKYDFPLTTESSKEETSHMSLSPVTDGFEHAADDNLSTMKEIHIGEDTLHTTLSSITDGSIHTTEDNLLTSHVPEDEISHTVSEEHKHVTEAIEDDITFTTIIPVTDESQHITGDNLLTELPKKETSSTLSPVTGKHDITEDITIVTEVSKQVTSHTTSSSITDLPQHITDEDKLKTTSSLDENERVTEINTGKPEHITDGDLIHTTLSPVTTIVKDVTEDNNAATTVAPEKEISYTTLNPINNDTVYVTESTLSTIDEIPKEEKKPVSSEPGGDSETMVPIIKESDDVTKKPTPSIIETTTHVEPPHFIDYTTTSQDINHSTITDTIDYSTVKPDIYDDNKEKQPTTISENAPTSDTDYSPAITDNNLVKEETTVTVEPTNYYQSTEKVTYPIIDDEEKYFTDYKITTIQEPSKTEVTKAPKEELSTKLTTDEKEPTNVSGEGLPSTVTEKATAITDHVYSDTTSSEKDEHFPTDSGLQEEYEATTNKNTEIRTSKPGETYTSSPEDHTRQHEDTTVGNEVKYDQTTGGNIAFDTTNKEKGEQTTSVSIDSTTDKTSYEEPDKNLNTIIPEIHETDISTTEHIKLSTDVNINDYEKYTTISSQEIQSQDITKDLDLITEINKGTTQSLFTESESVTQDDILHEPTTMRPSENEVLDEKDIEQAKSTTIKPEQDFTTKAQGEPDRGLNTVPVEHMDEETGKITTESNLKEQQSTEATPTESITVKQFTKEDEKLDTTIIDKFITTTGKFDEKIQTEHPHYQTVDTDGTQHDNELTTTSINVLKDVATEVAGTQTTVLTELTTEKIEDLTENEIPEEHGPHIQSPGVIPGEGSCLIEGVTYSNYSIVPSINKCQSNCKCISSIVKCDPIHCSPPPEYMINCQPVYDATDSCCPSYVCDDSKETIPPQPHSQMSVTDSSTSVECGESCQTDTSTSKTDKKCDDKQCEVKEDDIIPVTESELCSSGKCIKPGSNIAITAETSTIQHKDSESVTSATETSVTEVSNESGSTTKKVDIECTGDTCTVKHITPDNADKPADCLPGKCDDQNIDLTTENLLVPGDKNLTIEEYTTTPSKLDETTPHISKDVLSTEEVVHVTENTMTTKDVQNKEDQPIQETKIPQQSTTLSMQDELEITTDDSVKASTQSPELIEMSKPEEVGLHDKEVSTLGEIVTVSPDLKTTIIMSLQSEATESTHTAEYTQFEDEIKTTSKYDDTEENKTHYPTEVEPIASEKVPTEETIFATSEPNKLITNEITTATPSKLHPETTVQKEEITTDVNTKIIETTVKYIDDEKTETTTPYFVELVEHPHMIDENIDSTTEDENIITTITSLKEDKIETKLTTIVPDIVSSTEHIDEGLNTIQPDYSADHTLDYESTNLPDIQSTSTEKHDIKLDEFETTTAKDARFSETPLVTEMTHKQTSVTESKPHIDVTNEITETTENNIADSGKHTTSPTIHLSTDSDDKYLTSSIQDYHTTSNLPELETTIDDEYRKTTLSHEAEFTSSTSKPNKDIPELSVTTNLTPTSNEYTEAVTENKLELDHTSEPTEEIKKINETSPTLPTTADDSIIVFVDDNNDTENVTFHKDVPSNVDKSKITPNEQTTPTERTSTPESNKQTDINESTFHDYTETTSMKSHEVETTKFIEVTESSLTSTDHDEVLNKDITTLPPYIEKETTPHVAHEETTTYTSKTDEISHTTTKPSIEDGTTISEDMLEKSSPLIISENQTTKRYNIDEETTVNMEYTKYTTPKEEYNNKDTTIKPYIEQETESVTDKSQGVTEDTVYKTESTTKANAEPDTITQGLEEEHITDKFIKDEQTEAPTTLKPYHETPHVEVSTTVKEIITEKSPYDIKTTSSGLVQKETSTEKVLDTKHEESTTIKQHDASSSEVEETNETASTYKPTTGILLEDFTTMKNYKDKDTPVETTTPKLVTEHLTEQFSEEIITQGEIKSTSESTLIHETETSIPLRDVTLYDDKHQTEIMVETVSSESPEISKITSEESTSAEDTSKFTTTTPKYDDESSSSEVPLESHPIDLPKPVVTQKPEDDTSVDDTDQQSEELPPSGTGGYGQEPDYGEDDQAFGPGTCRYGGKVYVSAQQIPRDDPCDFCFCFRSDIICLQQSCPPPIHGCHEEPIQGFCCPRYECPVSMGTSLNMTTTTTTTTTTLPPHFLPHAYKGAAQRKGCQIKGHTYQVGEVVRASSGPCLHCTCGGDGQMKCDPKACTPEPMLRQMIAAAVASKRRR